MARKEIAGIIRWTSGGLPYLLDDPNHTPILLSGAPVVNGNYIEVPFDVTLTEINTFFAVADDSLTAAGIFSGASCGLDKIYITLRDTGTNAVVNPTSITDTSANVNIWVLGTDDEEEPPAEREASRYFIIEKENSAGGGFYHTEMKLYDSSGQIAVTSGMLSNPTGGLGGWSASALVDGSTAVPAFHTDSAGAGTRIVVDFGSGNEKLVTQVDLHVNGAVVASWKGLDSSNGTTGSAAFTGFDCSGGSGWKTKII